jgi:hypothetical protein
MESARRLLKLWVGLRWTARTVGDDTILFFSCEHSELSNSRLSSRP